MRLAYLIFAPNVAYCQVVDTAPEEVTVDQDKKTWKYKGSPHQQEYKIGRARYLGNSRGGVIGVYDLNDIEQVDSLVHDAIESQRDYSNAD